MPMLIDAIDEVSRDLQRDVLFLTFSKAGVSHLEAALMGEELDWKRHPSRRSILAWLKKQGIGHRPCAPFSNSGWIIGYIGSIYIDVPPDPGHPDYQRLLAFLEDENGDCKWPDTQFWLLELATALRMTPSPIEDEFADPWSAGDHGS